MNIDGMMDFDNSNPPTSGVLSPNAQDVHQLMKASEFTGIRDLFSDFTFNRRINEKERLKEANEQKLKGKESFIPNINSKSVVISQNLI